MRKTTLHLWSLRYGNGRQEEHYYNPQGWYYHHRDFYDSYDREGTKVYLGEWASQGNDVSNALVEAAYLCNLERNADVVVMSSYAPLLAKEGHSIFICVSNIGTYFICNSTTGGLNHLRNLNKL